MANGTIRLGVRAVNVALATAGAAAMPLLRALDAEQAHGLALRALRLGLVASGEPDSPRLATTLAGIALKNPIGLAAGFDKDAVALAGLSRAGFGFLEAGTVTRLPQPGNKRPRLFRLPEDRAVINRMGFNNAGIDAFVARLEASTATVPVGVNIGLNKTGANPVEDYPALARAVGGMAAYITINVSSPNTPGLRDLQAPDRLAGILRAVRIAVPEAMLFVKLAPDLADDAVPEIVLACEENDAQGLIISNTTVARPAGLMCRHAAEPGGLSGEPLRERALTLLRLVAGLCGGRMALIGVGGIRSGADILARLQAGASAVQIYTALALEGPRLLERLKRELLAELDAMFISNVAAAIGTTL